MQIRKIKTLFKSLLFGNIDSKRLVIRELLFRTKTLIVFTFSWILLKNKNISNINLFERKVFSQHGEDGILRYLFEKIGTTNKFCVEFGVEDGRECNSRYLREMKGWSCLWLDGDHQSDTVRGEFITAENIEKIFRKYNVPRKFDFLSIDIDFNDYWVWNAIKKYSPRVVVIEYNSSIPPTESRVVRYNPSAIWDGTNYFGASLLALEKLARSKGYSLICCDSYGVNAFFVENELARKLLRRKSASEAYKPPKYGTKFNGKYIGHPKSENKMIKI